MKQKNYNFIIGGSITCFMVLLILIGFFYTPYDPEKMDSSLKFADVSLKHIMGCDNFGRDMFSRILKGCGTTLFVATGTVLIGALMGILIGAFTGYYGGLLDEVLMRVIDALFAFPSILLALVFIAVLGSGKNNG